MTRLRFRALSTEVADTLRAGEPDANGQPPEHHVAGGTDNPCRHCLTEIGDGQPMLILAHRPFPGPQPYAEIGPIFLHAEPCERYSIEAEAPPMLLAWERLLIRGYADDDRIVYGTGQVVPTARLVEAASGLLERREVAYLHVRSASNNCYQCRIDRAG